MVAEGAIKRPIGGAPVVGRLPSLPAGGSRAVPLMVFSIAR